MSNSCWNIIETSLLAHIFFHILKTVDMSPFLVFVISLSLISLTVQSEVIFLGQIPFHSFFRFFSLSLSDDV